MGMGIDGRGRGRPMSVPGRLLSSSILSVCMASLTSTILTFKSLTCLSSALIAYISGLYLSYLVLVDCWMDLSCVNVNLVICM